MHLRNRALYAVSPSSNPRVSCLADAPPLRPPRWQPFRFARRRPSKPPRREISAHPTTGSGFRQPSAAGHRVSPFCVVPRATVSCPPCDATLLAHMPNHGVAAARRLSGAKASSAASGIRKAPCSLSKGPPEWSSGAGRRAGGTGHGWPGSGSLVCLLRIPETFHMPASLRACGVRTGDTASLPPGASWRVGDCRGRRIGVFASTRIISWPDGWAFC